ncbi:Os03g0104800, partial [Oryza sativa Japonica Group]
ILKARGASAEFDRGQRRHLRPEVSQGKARRTRKPPRWELAEHGTAVVAWRCSGPSVLVRRCAGPASLVERRSGSGSRGNNRGVVGGSPVRGSAPAEGGCGGARWSGGGGAAAATLVRREDEGAPALWWSVGAG